MSEDLLSKICIGIHELHVYIYSLSFHALMIKCREEKGSKNRWHFKREESEEKELESSCHEAGAETLDY